MAGTHFVIVNNRVVKNVLEITHCIKFYVSAIYENMIRYFGVIDAPCNVFNINTLVHQIAVFVITLAVLAGSLRALGAAGRGGSLLCRWGH